MPTATARHLATEFDLGLSDFQQNVHSSGKGYAITIEDRPRLRPRQFELTVQRRHLNAVVAVRCASEVLENHPDHRQQDRKQKDRANCH